MKEVTLIMDEISVLIDTIKHTSIYTEYQSALEDLQRYPELKEKADEFRRENYRILHALKEPISFADFDSLEEIRLELAAFPQVDRYLKAELALCRILQEIQSRVATAMSFD